MNKRSKFGERSTRQLRMGELVKARLAEVFNRGDLHHSKLYGVSLTVTEVQLSPDMRHGDVYIWPLGEHDPEEILQALNKYEAPRLNAAVAKIMRTRSTPRLVFHLETVFDQASHLEALLQDPKIQQDLHKDDDDSESI